MTKKKEKIIFYCFFLVIFVISFFLYSPFGSIRFTSDHAIHVLMAYDFKSPDNLYFWGQNRLGSIVPMLAHFIGSVLPISAIASVTIIHWGMLMITCLLICRYFSSTLLKILFLACWMIPLPPFKEHLTLSHPYGPQLFLIFSGIFLFEKSQAAAGLRKYIFFAIGVFTLLLSCWVSELSACFIFIYFAFNIFWKIRIKQPEIAFSKKDTLLKLAIFSVISFAVYLFISYAKSHAETIEGYATILSGVKEWIAGVSQHLSDITTILSGFALHPLKFLYILLFASILCFSMVLIFKKTKPFHKQELFYVYLFLLTGVSIWFGLYALSWTNQNQYDYRHWTFPYVFVFLGILLLADKSSLKLNLFKLIALALILIQIPISVVYATDKKTNRWDVDFSYSEFKNFKKLGNCGLIGNFWFTYVVAAADPENIVASPREFDYARGKHLIPLVFKKQKIYLAKNRWLEIWSPIIGQYGHLLKKNGVPFFIDRVEFCEYKISDADFDLGQSDLQYRNAEPIQTGKLLINRKHEQLNDFVVFGPFISLPKGNYKGAFLLDGLIISEHDTVVVDIISDWGKLLLFRKVITKNEIYNTSQSVTFGFSLPVLTENIETRIHVNGSSSFLLKSIHFSGNY